MTTALTQEAQQDFNQILTDGYNDLGLICRSLFPETYFIPFSDMHQQILDAIDARHPKVVIAAPRGMGKTSIIRAAVMRAILMRDVPFIVYVSNSETAASMQTQNIKRELRMTPIIRKAFGDIKVSQAPEMDDMDFGGLDADDFSKLMWVAFGQTLVLPRGMGQQIRGLNWRSQRPGLILVDDLEEAAALDNPVQRQKINDWFHSDLVKAVPQFSGIPSQIIYIDTVKHEGSLIEELLQMDSWHGIRLSICTDDYKTLAPDFVTQEDLDIEITEARKHHKLDIFARESMSMPISKENQVFKLEYFKYYKETDIDFITQLKDCVTVVIGDPAKTSNMENAESGIVTISVNTLTHAIYVRDPQGLHLRPDEFYKTLFDQAVLYNAKIVAVEVTGLDEFVKQPVTNYMMQHGLWFTLEWLKARRGEGEFAGVGGGKKGRIAALAPYCRQGAVYLNEHNCGKLVSQLLPFPRGKKVDVADATAYIIELMEIYRQYFDADYGEVPSDDEMGRKNEMDFLALSADYDQPIQDWVVV